VVVQVAPGRPLTHRELEVALLAARGMRTADIARLLFVSPRTIDAHLSHVYAKTGTGNRVRLVNWLLEQAPAADTNTTDDRAALR
jgi:DNA-binding CsgD family transcriptional regulator